MDKINIGEHKKNIISKRTLNKLIEIPEITILTTLIVTLIVESLVSPNFLSFDNLLSILRNVSYSGIVAVFMTLLLMSKGFDMSCDASAAMSSVIFATALVNNNMPVYAAVLLALGGAFLIGVINSVVIIKGKIPAFIATLGMMNIAKSIGYEISHGLVIPGLPIELMKFINTKILGLPLDVIIFIVIAVCADLILRFTVTGRKIVLIGVNYDTAILSGIKAKKIITMLYIGTAVSASLAAILFTFRSRMGMGDIGTNWSLQAITGCIIGGTSIYGGKGSILGTILGVIFMGSLTNIMIQTGIQTSWQFVGLGVFMVLGILLDLFRSNRTQRSLS